MLIDATYLTTLLDAVHGRHERVIHYSGHTAGGRRLQWVQPLAVTAQRLLGRLIHSEVECVCRTVEEAGRDRGGGFETSSRQARHKSLK